MYCHMPDTGACAEINDGNRAASGQRHTGKSSCNLCTGTLHYHGAFLHRNGDVFLLAGSRAKAGFAFCGADTAHVPQHGAGNNPLAAAFQAL